MQLCFISRITYLHIKIVYITQTFPTIKSVQPQKTNQVEN
jgi:uncharacterized membrane protein (UPF0127 family)